MFNEGDERLIRLARRKECTPHAFALILDTFAYLNSRRGSVRGHVSPHELVIGLCAYSVETFGLLAHTVLANVGLPTSELVGLRVFQLIEADIVAALPSDRIREFGGIMVFDEPTFIPFYQQIMRLMPMCFP